MQVQQESGKKRLSLDVFQEKAVGTTHDAEQGGVAAATTVPCSIISILSIIFTLSSDSSRCCTSSDCHPSSN